MSVKNQQPSASPPPDQRKRLSRGTRQEAPKARLLVFISITAIMTFTSLVSAKHFGDWGAPVNAESIPGTSSELNTTSNDGYPIESPDGLSLYIVSDRPGGMRRA